MTKTRVNGVLRDMTEAEEAQHEKDKIKMQAHKDAIAQKATDKANAKAKLISGEALTEAEADTIVI
jgi:hypothetical protein